ncbi:UNVERIFIED_CONTAM: putative disease resistance protein RGA4 [Sesamum angustifolium]|uniref:Disease resistance protein RGA4 n=1 Tax=Sesamum angustifolium TaxID=2727405 RepID=A0AAW2RI16_9LAMI
MPVGELFLGAFLQVLFDRLASGLILAFARRERIYKLLKKWSQTLRIIQAVIDDAEEKQLTDNAVKLWLEHLRDLAFDLDDVLDEIATQALMEKSEGVQERSGKIWKFIPSCKDCTPGALMFKKRMRSRIEEISTRLEDIEKTGNSLNLSQNVRAHQHEQIA